VRPVILGRYLPMRVVAVFMGKWHLKALALSQGWPNGNPGYRQSRLGQIWLMEGFRR